MNLLTLLSQVPVSVYDGNLQNVPLTGITKLVANIIEYFSFGGYIAVGILIFSLLLKILPLPLDIYSRVATKKNALRMERMRPELEKLQKQYANNKELYSKKMMALYKKEGYSTFASCLPTLFTLVFFIVVISAFTQYSTFAKIEVFNSNNIPAEFEGLDAGPLSREKFAKAIEGAKTILWNGPAGCFECDEFTAGSRAIGDAIAKATAEGAFSLIGGGDSVACVNKFGLADKVSYISTGGGALLEAIEGKVLPGVAAIKGE